MGRKQGMRQLSRAALQVAEGVFAYSVDLGLWITMYMASMGVPQSQYGQLWRAKRNADQFLNQINYEVFKNAIQTARKRGWIKIVKRQALPEITAEGKKRLEAILPHYDKNRVWDGRMHLVTYDIPEKKSSDRYLLREYLRVIGCGLLQESVWITPYNPIDTLRGFVEQHGLKGNIIVSDMGKDGSIGEEDLRAMIVRVYRLEQINERYEKWLEAIEDQDGGDQLSIVSYLAILKDDPQLPFSLLPPWWKGDSAYQRIKTTLKKVVNELSTGVELTI
ncbi:MAG: hypothetical protein AAB937_00380 [Patescibacteria group bacterium]